MKVTVCELRTEPSGLAEDWAALVHHAQVHRSELVLLPEMPFSPWFALTPSFDLTVWQAAVDVHERWLTRLPELGAAVVIGSRPVNRDGLRLNEGFWEASWYQRGSGPFVLAEAAGLKFGMVICTELWFLQHARAYGLAGAHLIATPRATGKPTVDKWLAGGRVQAVVSGAYSLSSNHVSDDVQMDLGGQGWIIDPDGQVLAITSRQQPFVTVEIDLARAEAAKNTYPRYVLE